MRCPFCGTLDNRVIDSRLSHGGDATRRRRECDGCGRRYTTYERVEQTLPLIVKRDGRRQPFDRDKLLAGLQRACVKRPVPGDAVERLLEDVERWLAEIGRPEISSHELGDQILSGLRSLDEVAYVRFASVYRDFQDAQEFLKELSSLVDERP